MSFNTLSNELDNTSLNSYAYFLNNLKRSNKIYMVSFFVSSLVNLILILSLLFIYFSTITKPRQIPYVIFMDEKNLSYYKLGAVSNINNIYNEKLFKVFISNYLKYLRGFTLDKDINNEYLNNLNYYTHSDITTFINTIINDDSIYDHFGTSYRSIDIISLLTIDMKKEYAFSVEWRENTYELNRMSGIYSLSSSTRYKAIVKLIVSNKTDNNPLGIYISSFDYNIIKEDN